MGWIYIIKPLSSVLSSAANKYHQHQEKSSWERQELNLGLLGVKQVCYLCAMQHPPPQHEIFTSQLFSSRNEAESVVDDITYPRYWRAAFLNAENFFNAQK